MRIGTKEQLAEVLAREGDRIQAGMTVKVVGEGNPYEGQIGRALYRVKTLQGKESEPVTWAVQIGEHCLPKTIYEHHLEEVQP